MLRRPAPLYPPSGDMISSSAAQRRARLLSVPLLVAVGSAVLIIIGSLGPWARVPGYRAVYGSADEGVDVFWVMGTAAPGIIPLVGDGIISLIFGGVAEALALWRVGPANFRGFVFLAGFFLLLVN